MSYKFSIGNQDTAASAVYINGLTAVSASVVSGSDFKGSWTGEAIVSSYINDLAASKLTGQLANARVAEANVTQHQTAITALGVLTGLKIAASGYSNFGTTAGTGGYGIRDNSGTIQFKSSGGSWTNLGTAADLTTNNALGATSSHLHQITGTLAVSGTLETAPSLYVSSADPSVIRVGIGLKSPTHDFDVNGNTRLRGGVVLGRRSKTSAYTVAVDDHIIGVGTDTAAVTLTLPDADTFTAGQVFIVKDEDGNAATNNITITTDTSGDKIDGANSVVLDVDRASVNIYTDGSANYFVY
jgi:hypothetical protein